MPITPPKQGKPRSMLKLVRFIVFIYKIFFLLGFHALYVRKSDIEAQNSEVESERTASPKRIQSRNWHQTLGEGAHTFNERFTPLLLNGSALYVCIQSDIGGHSILRAIGVISIVISANASILSVLFVYWAPVLFNSSIGRDIASLRETLAVDRATQVAMLKSIPHAGYFWSWVFHAIYRGSSAAFAIIDLDGKNISDESTPTEPPTGLSFWCTISIFAVLGLCFVHFFVVIAWLTNIATQVTTCSPASVQTSISESSLPHERYVGQELHERDTLPTQNPASGYDSLSQAHIGMHGHRKKGLRRTKSAHTIYENRKQEAKLVEANIGSSAIQKSLSDSSALTLRRAKFQIEEVDITR